ncbi:sugar phosphate isomerase/epimerase family protein [Paenibacillus sacheonensis]|uniref:TIM barrel protein n=1 Tax=Paenibacillus sacheonensis TaxID=742054 RepID=A0A7X5BWZ6_9BACL|nr:sugar phosphate isomerase/epimerase family protein [Paenibacillus sacheonensis]NBC69933.1 TIM barrel protein [Paenibacillus sacheonensis]
MKLSIFTVAAPDLTPEELCEAAAAAGIAGLEWRCKETPAELLQEKPSFWGNNQCTISPNAGDAEISRFRHAAAGYNRQTIAVTPYLACGDIEGTEQVLRLAKRLDASMVRVGVPGYDRSKPYGELFGQAVRYLKEVERLALEYGVKALVETHHQTIAPSASLAHRLVSAFNPDAVGVLYDPGNMVHEGFENYRMGMELLGPYLAHVHVKNAGWQSVSPGTTADHLNPVQWNSGWAPIANGIVPWKQVLRDLRAVGYDGWFGVEDFSGTFDTRTMLQAYADQMNTWMEEIE